MRDISRIERICKEIQELWNLVPDWRFCQLFANIQRFCAIPDMFFIEDDKFEEYMKEFRQHLIETESK